MRGKFGSEGYSRWFSIAISLKMGLSLCSSASQTLKEYFGSTSSEPEKGRGRGMGEIGGVGEVNHELLNLRKQHLAQRQVPLVM